ncbi:MAG: hypothetical protein JO287_11530 [Pseudonocardiales bacterium]|nr:hypothetical protein [Pseudonocardiales bacterium]
MAPADQLPVLGCRGYPAAAGGLPTEVAHPLAHAVPAAEPVWRGSRSADVAIRLPIPTLR